jgi:hypothetical protein
MSAPPGTRFNERHPVPSIVALLGLAVVATLLLIANGGPSPILYQAF